MNNLQSLKTKFTINPKLGATYALVSFLHVVIGAYLGVYYQHQLNSGFDKLLLKLVDVIYALKDAF